MSEGLKTTLGCGGGGWGGRGQIFGKNGRHPEKGRGRDRGQLFEKDGRQHLGMGGGGGQGTTVWEGWKTTKGGCEAGTACVGTVEDDLRRDRAEDFCVRREE